MFSRSVTASLSVTSALEALTPEIGDIMGRGAVEIWLHDRRNRQLFLTAATDGAAGASPVATDDTGHYAAAGMRLDRPRTARPPARGTAPWLAACAGRPGDRARDGPAEKPNGRHDTGRAAARAIDDVEFMEFARELARQLSVGIENVQLLDDILRQRRLLEDTFNSLVDLVAVMDKELRVVQTNEAFAARVGLKRGRHLRRPLRELVGPDTLAYVEAADTWQGIVPAVQRRVDDQELDGTFLLTATPLTSAEGHTLGRVLVARDITRQTRLEAERAALRERLAQSEKLASLGQFVAGIAHEMNNPLQGVMGHLELLMEMTAGGQAGEEASSSRSSRKRIAPRRSSATCWSSPGPTASRGRRRRWTASSRRALASRKAHLARGRHEDRAQARARSCPPCSATPPHLQQAFLNMIINAEHAVMDDGGRARRIEIGSSIGKGGKQVVITIRDFGTGIAADVMPRIFDPFFTTKEVGQGTGLGLAITYGIVAEHGGTITAHNAEDGGAVFQIELPAASVGGKVNGGSRMMDESFLTTEEVLEYLQVNLRTVYRLIKAGRIPAVRVGRQWRFRKRDIDAWLESQRPRGARACGDAAAPGNPRRPPAAPAYSSWTTRPRSGICCRKRSPWPSTTSIMAPDGRTALERLRIIAYDLLITDLKMPGVDGLTVIREARRLKADLPVIIITGFSNEASAIEAVNLGVSGYLTKPFRVLGSSRRHQRPWANNSRFGNLEIW